VQACLTAARTACSTKGEEVAGGSLLMRSTVWRTCRVVEAVQGGGKRKERKRWRTSGVEVVQHR
jgi:hypothetical protein